MTGKTVVILRKLVDLDVYIEIPHRANIEYVLIRIAECKHIIFYIYIYQLQFGSLMFHFCHLGRLHLFEIPGATQAASLLKLP